MSFIAAGCTYRRWIPLPANPLLCPARKNPNCPPNRLAVPSLNPNESVMRTTLAHSLPMRLCVLATLLACAFPAQSAEEALSATNRMDATQQQRRRPLLCPEGGGYKNPSHTP